MVYEEIIPEVDLRFDLMAENKVWVDLKSKETVPPAGYKIFKTYLRLTEIPIGLVINLNVEYLKDGIKKRIVNNFIDENK